MSRDPLDDVARRTTLAADVVRTLEALPEVVEVRPYGSIGTDRADRYSDIDLMVVLHGVSDQTFAFELPRHLDVIGPRLIDGWGLGLLPEQYIRKFYFEDHPLFWNVDIGCVSEEHVDGTELRDQYHWPQVFAMWVKAVKGLLRGEDSVSPFVAHISRWADTSRLPGSRPRASVGRSTCVPNVPVVVGRRTNLFIGVAASSVTAISGLTRNVRVPIEVSNEFAEIHRPTPWFRQPGQAFIPKGDSEKYERRGDLELVRRPRLLSAAGRCRRGR